MVAAPTMMMVLVSGIIATSVDVAGCVILPEKQELTIDADDNDTDSGTLERQHPVGFQHGKNHFRPLSVNTFPRV